MNFLDVRTVIFSQIVTYAVCTAVLAYLWTQTRRRFSGTVCWLLDFGFQTAAAVLITLRGTLPDWLSIVVANTLVTVGALLGYIGLTLFVEQKSRQAHNAFLVAITVAALAYFTFGHPDIAARHVIVSLGLLIICFQCAWLALRRAEPGGRRAAHAVGLVFVGVCLVSAIRIVVSVASPPPSNDLFQSGLADTLLRVAYQILFTLLAFGLAMMVNQRLLGDLQTQEEKFSEAFRCSPDALMLSRASDDQIREVNEGFVTLSGYSPAEAVGKTAQGLKLWAMEADHAAVVADLAQRKRVRDREYQFRKKSGELRHGLFSAETIQISGERWRLSTIRDITELKQVGAALAESEALHHLVVDNLGEGVAMADPQERFLFANPAAEQLFGVPPGRLAGRSLLDFLTPEQAALVQAQTELRRRGETSAYELEILRPDGERRTVLLTATARHDEAGHYLGAFGIFRDVTERTQLEDVQRFLAQGHSASEDFFAALARYLARSLGMDYVCIDQLEPERLAARTVAIYFDGHFEDNVTYTLHDTPCGDVVGKPVCCFPRRVRHLFPRDAVLQEMNAESYLGVTLWNSQAQPIGLIAVIGRRPLTNPALAEAVLKQVAVRAAGELERREAEKALRESEERFRGLFEYSPISLWEEDFSAVKAWLDDLRRQGVTDMVGYFAYHPEGMDESMRRIRVLDVNQATLRLYGANSKSQVLNGLGQVFGPETCLIFAQELAAIARGEREFEGTGVNCKLTGERMEINLRWFIPSAHEQTLSRVIVSVLDITAERQGQAEISRLNAQLERRVEERTAQLEAAALAVRTSEEKYRTVADFTYDWEYWLAPDGNFLYVSPSCERVTGYRPEEFLSDPGLLEAITHPADRAGLAQHLHESDTCREPYALDFRILTRDGETRWIGHRCQPVFNAEGDYLGRRGSNRDITERLQAEVKIRQLNESLEQHVAELVQANQLKDEFLANMSHELRTPLTAILGLAETLQMGTYGPLPDQQADKVEVIRQSGQHLLELITDILDLSRIEAGKMTLQLAPAVVTDVCEGSLQLVRQAAQQKNIRVTFSSDPQVSLLEVDGRRLRQMLVNLLNNAVKFTPQGGQVKLEVTGDPLHQEVRFSIWDTGIGIPLEKQDLLFRPFVQVDGGLSRRYEGTGLGLALTRRLAEMHGGRVSAESAGADRGSRFTIVLPWRAVATGPLSVQPVAQKNPTLEPRDLPLNHLPVILVADDSEASLMTIGDFLENLPARVMRARNGGEALAQAQTTRVDLILMDIQMPGLNGLQAIRRLRAAPQTAQTPIIALTALAMPGDRERCLAAGADEYLSKPVGLERLTETVTQLLARPGPAASKPPE